MDRTADAITATFTRMQPEQGRRNLEPWEADSIEAKKPAIPGKIGYNGVLQQSGPGGAQTPRGRTPEGLVPMPPHDSALPVRLGNYPIKYHEIECASCKRVLPRDAFDFQRNRKGHRAGLKKSCRECRSQKWDRPTAAMPNPDDPSGETVLLPLTQGKFAVIDAADAERCAKHLWCVYWDRHKNRWGAHRRRKKSEVGTQQNIGLHQFLLECPESLEIDHIDGDPLNNSRSNLRICTHTQNLWNRPARQNSGYKGVWLHSSGKWHAAVAAHGERHRLGTFDDAESAARAYDAKARELHGEFAFLNFPEEES